LPTGPRSSAALSKSRRSECPAGVEPACPVWKTGALAARPRARFAQRKEKELNPQGSSLVRVQAGCRRQSACPSVCSLDGWIRTSVVRLPTPADDAGLSYIRIRRPPGPPKKAGGRVTPGLLGVRPGGFGVPVAEGRRPAPGGGNGPGRSPAPDSPRSLPDCVSSCPLLRPP